ncbi:hypothetical protein HN832_02455 [archaeon]|nr:hypothetical protein [archaeon]MBT4373216.1 hypothetical protein [archaeon]MBT4531561.1 hypothetical protein [archaeon]MBT7001261.1 hypothetical protein [archaeon]MBT7282253.1 hypothetical protein [archaeon]
MTLIKGYLKFLKYFVPIVIGLFLIFILFVSFIAKQFPDGFAMMGLLLLIGGLGVILFLVGVILALIDYFFGKGEEEIKTIESNPQNKPKTILSVPNESKKFPLPLLGGLIGILFGLLTSLTYLGKDYADFGYIALNVGAATFFAYLPLGVFIGWLIAKFKKD